MKLKKNLILFIVFSNVLCQINANTFKNNNGFEVSVQTVDSDPMSDRTKWPWLVAFTHNEKNRYFCGGSLISKRNALSAAHCFQNKAQVKTILPEHVTAHLGKFNLSIFNEPGSKYSWVSQIIVHSDWKPEDQKFDADIAVVVLGEEVEFSEFIQPVGLPHQSEADVTGDGKTGGWALINNSGESNGRVDETPMELDMSVIKPMRCLTKSPRLAEKASERMFCASYDNETEKACLEVSGAGFYVLDSSSIKVKGIVSSSTMVSQTCDGNKFLLFTNVGWFVDWIEDKMKETEEIEMVEVRLKCGKSDLIYLGYDYHCSHSFAGPFNQNIKISTTPEFTDSTWSADKVEKLHFYSRYSTHMFSGIGKTFQNLNHIWITGIIISGLNGLSIKFLKRHDFADLSKLKGLMLELYQMTYIPEDTLFDLPALETMKIYRSQLQTLPQNLFLLSNNLIELGLYNNLKLTHIPDDLFKNTKKLKKLDFPNNKLKKLSKKLKEKIPQLEVLILTSNPLELSVDLFTELSKLKELSLEKCDLMSLPDGIFNSLTQLEILNLKGNQLNYLTENIFAKNINLKGINLWGNKFRKIEYDFTMLEKIDWVYLESNDCIDAGFGGWWHRKNSTVLELQNAIDTKCH